MTLTSNPTTSNPTTSNPTTSNPTTELRATTGPLTYDQVTLDLYRDIHKGIRSELFAITVEAGRTDPADRTGHRALAAHVDDVMVLLIEHAEHEDGPIQPVLERELPDLAERIAVDHATLEHRIEGLRDQARTIGDGPRPGDERAALHRLYVELASFTGAYLAHQDLEERVVMPALETAVGIDAVVAIHGAIVGPMPPEELTRSLALMLPVMNTDDRTEMVGGILANAPAEVGNGVWSLTTSVLDPVDLRPLAARLGR